VTTTTVASPTHREPELLGQTVVVIGGSAGIGLETARRARAEGADVVITARNPDRLHQVGLELGALSTAAFDATDFARLEQFFRDLPDPIDHVLVSGSGPYYAPFAELDFEEARRDVEAHLWLQLQVARHAPGRVRPGGTLLFIGGTGGRRPNVGPTIAALTAATPAMVKSLALELAPVRVNLLAPGFVGHTAVGVVARRQARRAPRRAPGDAADRAGRPPRGRRCLGRARHDEHGADGSNLRHRRRPAVGRLSCYRSTEISMKEANHAF
jgi:NAD(P)-dependent dehydrogenase (short-subunit alcohol dehydrogenase family)